MSSKRITQLDGLRTIAVLAVFAHHAFHVKGLWMGVDLFFILSGFLITGILSGNKVLPWKTYIGKFYERRVRRILPPYIMALILTTVFFGTAWMKHGYMYVLLMNFIKPLGLDSPDPFAVLWSLAVEEQFYLVWPVVVFCMSEVAMGWTAFGLVLLAPILRGLCTPLFKLEWAVYMLTPFRMDCLAVGALIALAWKYHRAKIERFGQWGLVATLAGLGGLASLLKTFHVSPYGNTVAGNVWTYEFSLLACTGVMLWALSGRGVGFLRWKPVTYIGQISYTVYLVHLLTLMVVARYMQGEAKVACVALAVTLAYASASWFLLEKPLLHARARNLGFGSQDGRTP